MRGLAAEGRTVLLSSHLMSEMAQTADQLIVVGRGRILADGPIDDVITGVTRSLVRVRTRDAALLTAAIAAPGVVVSVASDGALEIAGLSSEHIAVAASAAGVVLYEVASINGSLEDAYLALTADEVEYRSSPTRARTSAPTGAHR
jgi:ABC-2 type transport system ATP-binding protein